MTSNFAILLVIIVVCAGAIYLRRRYWALGAPLRNWYDTRMRARLKPMVTAFFLVTLVIWIAIWAVARKEQEYDFLRDVRELFPQVSKQFGKAGPGPDEKTIPENITK